MEAAERNVSRWQSTALPLALILIAALTGACSDSDDDGGGGGGGFTFPAIPTARPTLTGLGIVFDTSGGNGAAGAVGGDAGDINMVASYRNVAADDGRGLPSIDNNFLTAAVLADNTVTYAELIAIDPSNANIVNTAMVIDLDGFDFYLPAGATLDLGDAPVATVDEVVLRSLGVGDRLRIDGDVVSARATGDASNFVLVCETAAGTSVTVSGDIDLRGNAANPDGGEFTVISSESDILIRGTVTTTGQQPAAGAGGAGGDIGLVAGRGRVLVRAGLFQLNGGGGTTGGAGGDVNAQSGEAASFAWGVRSNGGAGTTGVGGAGGSLNAVSATDLTVSASVELNGGASTSSTGGDGGSANATGYYVHGVITGTCNGGDGATGGGAGGSTNMFGESVTGAAIDMVANGGASSGGPGGQGGTGFIGMDGLYGVNLLVEGQYLGGSGNSGGSGGAAQIQGYSLQRNANIDVDLSGGIGNSGAGGNGGQVGVTMFSGLGESLEDVNLVVVSNGGNGTTGGDGGGVGITASFGTSNNVDVQFTMNGGTGTTGPGGNGGSIQFAGGINADLLLAGDANGGASNSNGGGGGGSFVFNFTRPGGYAVVNTTGTVNADGGISVSGAGGTGGRIEVTTETEKSFMSSNLSFSLNGGDSQQDDAGSAMNSNSGQPGVEFDCNGPITIQGGTLTLNGGTGSTVSGAGVGGQGGEVRIYTTRHDITLAGTIIANGGDGVGGGGSAYDNGSSEAIEVNPDSDDDAGSGDLFISGVLRANGGDCTGANGDGGDAGYIWIVSQTGNTSSGGDFYISGTLESIGGNGAGSNTSGGDGLGVEISTDGSIMDISGTVLVQGGSGDTGGSVANGPQLSGNLNCVITISGSVQGIGGNGTNIGGDGAIIEIGNVFVAEAASINVTATAVIRSQAGSGVTNGVTGTIDLDAVGAGGANVTIDASATVEVLDGTGGSVPGNITID